MMRLRSQVYTHLRLKVDHGRQLGLLARHLHLAIDVQERLAVQAAANGQDSWCHALIVLAPVGDRSGIHRERRRTHMPRR